MVVGAACGHKAQFGHEAWDLPKARIERLFRVHFVGIKNFHPAQSLVFEGLKNFPPLRKSVKAGMGEDGHPACGADGLDHLGAFWPRKGDVTKPLVPKVTGKGLVEGGHDPVLHKEGRKMGPAHRALGPGPHLLICEGDLQNLAAELHHLPHPLLASLGHPGKEGPNGRMPWLHKITEDLPSLPEDLGLHLHPGDDLYPPSALHGETQIFADDVVIGDGHSA